MGFTSIFIDIQPLNGGFYMIKNQNVPSGNTM